MLSRELLVIMLGEALLLVGCGCVFFESSHRKLAVSEELFEEPFFPIAAAVSFFILGGFSSLMGMGVLILNAIS